MKWLINVHSDWSYWKWMLLNNDIYKIYYAFVKNAQFQWWFWQLLNITANPKPNVKQAYSLCQKKTTKNWHSNAGNWQFCI